MRTEIFAIILAAASASAQAVVGKAYGFGAGATGGGSVVAVTPSNNEELARYLSDDTKRVILLTKTFDFTGKMEQRSGCDRKSCSVSNGGQLYLGNLSCGTNDNIAVTSIDYDLAGPTPLVVGSNKSILGVDGKGALKGKGMAIKKGASNVIIQGVEFNTINPDIVWGGDALDLKGGNTKIWVDHCKFSSTGRMFIVSHYDGASATLSNNEFDGVTTTSATCNGNHYWTMMFIGKNEKFTLDKNYFHDVSGRAPKLGQDGVSGQFHAINNYFENMKGHAFDAYTGANALVEGNAFVAVKQPSTKHTAGIATFISNAGSACSSAFGRVCLDNSVDSASGNLTSGSTMDFISALADFDVPLQLEASRVAEYVKANAGPATVKAARTARAVNNLRERDDTPGPASNGTAPISGTARLYGQCGGEGYSGPTACEAPATCVKSNEWYSQCINSSSKFRRAVVV